MIARILNKLGYVNRSQTVSIDDYMRLRAIAQEQLDEYRNFRRALIDKFADAPVALFLPEQPGNVVSLKQWKEQNK